MAINKSIYLPISSHRPTTQLPKPKITTKYPDTFIPIIKKDCKHPDSLPISTADFETVIYNNVHYPFCVTINIRGVLYYKYINIQLLEHDLSNISALSDQMLIKFWELLQAYNVTIVYFHNMSRFDGIFILQLCKLLITNEVINKLDVNIISRNRVFYKIKILNVDIRDSIHLLNSSLSKLSKSILKKSKQDIDINFTYTTICRDFNIILDYCKNDSQLLYDILYEFRIATWNEYKVDVAKCLTVSAFSFKIIRKFYLVKDSVQNTTNESNISNFVLESFRGGLSTVINPTSNNHDITSIDINSSYPHSMTKPLPVGKGIFMSKSWISDHIDILKDIMGYVDVELSVKPNTRISPLVSTFMGGLTDVQGSNVRVVLFTPELDFILNNGGKINKVYTFLKYDSGKPLGEFANDLYSKRLKYKSEGNEVMQMLMKLIMNSGYGRFALGETHESVNLMSIEDIDEIDSTRCGVVDQRIQMGSNCYMTTWTSIDKYKGDNQFVKRISKSKDWSFRGLQIASAVTSYSRINLLSTMINIESAGGTVHYCDTDSIYYSNLKDTTVIKIGNKLGEWKFENLEVNCIFIRPKQYIIKFLNGDINVKLAGLPNSIKPTWDNFVDVLKGETVNFEYDKVFIRDVKSLEIRKGIHRFSFKDVANSKRVKTYNDKGIWVSTTPINVHYDRKWRMIETVVEEDYNFNNSDKIEWKDYISKMNITGKYISCILPKSYETVLNFMRNIHLPDHMYRIVITTYKSEDNSGNDVVKTTSTNFMSYKGIVQKIKDLSDTYDIMYLRSVNLIIKTKHDDCMNNIVTNIISVLQSKIKTMVISYPSKIKLNKLLFKTILTIGKLGLGTINNFIYKFSKAIENECKNVIDRNSKKVVLKDTFNIIYSSVLNTNMSSKFKISKPNLNKIKPLKPNIKCNKLDIYKQNIQELRNALKSKVKDIKLINKLRTDIKNYNKLMIKTKPP